MRYLHSNGSQTPADWQNVGDDSYPSQVPSVYGTNDIRNFFQNLRGTSTEIMFLFGSGASLDWNRGQKGDLAPSTTDLWELVEKAFGTDLDELCKISGVSKEEKDIEKFLSQIDHLIAVESGAKLERLRNLVVKIEGIVREACDFLKNNQAPESHLRLFEWMSGLPRSNKYPRIYTTNYDLCLENAASLTGYSIIDGFSFGPQRRFAEKYLSYGFNSSGTVKSEQDMSAAHPVVGIYKLHGSVNWLKVLGRVVIGRNLDDLNVAKTGGFRDPVPSIIAPRSRKVEKETSPYFELNKRLFLDINLFRGTLIIIGFGFRDNDLTQMIQNAIFTNNSIQNLVVVAPNLESRNDEIGMRLINGVRNNDHRIWLYSGTFEEFSKLFDFSRVDLRKDILGWPIDQ